MADKQKEAQESQEQVAESSPQLTSLAQLEGMYPSLDQSYGITAQELITLRAKLLSILEANVVNVFDAEGNMIGQGVNPMVAPVQELYQMILKTMFARYYNEGSLVGVDVYEAQMQKLFFDQQQADAEAQAPTLVDANGETLTVEKSEE